MLVQLAGTGFPAPCHPPSWPLLAPRQSWLGGGSSEGLGLELTLCGVLALAEWVRLQHVLAAGTPGGGQRGLWGGICPRP